MKKGLAHAAVHECRVVGAEAIEYESERTRAHIAETQKRARELAREVQAARRSEMRGEDRLRHVEQVAKAHFDSQQRQLQEVAAGQKHKQDQMVTELQNELLQAQGQREHQQAVAVRAQAMSSQTQQEYELVQRVNHESQLQILQLRCELQEQARRLTS